MTDITARAGKSGGGGRPYRATAAYVRAFAFHWRVEGQGVGRNRDVESGITAASAIAHQTPGHSYNFAAAAKSVQTDRTRGQSLTLDSASACRQRRKTAIGRSAVPGILPHRTEIPGDLHGIPRAEIRRSDIPTHRIGCTVQPAAVHGATTRQNRKHENRQKFQS